LCPIKFVNTGIITPIECAIISFGYNSSKFKLGKTKYNKTHVIIIVCNNPKILIIKKKIYSFSNELYILLSNTKNLLRKNAVVNAVKKAKIIEIPKLKIKLYIILLTIFNITLIIPKIRNLKN